jgi:hypothetical protein
MDMKEELDQNLKDFVVDANRQLASVREMSWKSLSRSFNSAGIAIIASHATLDAIRNGEQEDPDGTEEAMLIALVNGLGYYQAALGKQMLERFPKRMVDCGLRSKGNPKQSREKRAWCNKDERWVPVNGGTIGRLDQQKAEIDEFIASLTSHEHSELIRVGTKVWNRSQQLMDEAGTASGPVAVEMLDQNELDDLCCLIKIAAVRLNDEFEKRWGDSIS